MFEQVTSDFGSGFSAVPFSVAAMRLGVAIALGAIIGFERERRLKPAGLRTHILVCLAACLFVLVGIELTELEFGDNSSMQNDPLRLIEAVTSGVAFLAAGIIFTSQGRVKNITTGASLWLTGAVGLACGAGQVSLAVLATALIAIVLIVIRQLERSMGTHPEEREDDPA